jgi:hypothetical protein
MKKLSKLQINSEKLMKNEELIIVKGGYSMYPCEIIEDGAWAWNDALPGNTCSDAETQYRTYLYAYRPGPTWEVWCCW